MLGTGRAPIFLAERKVIIKIESLTVKSGRFDESAETFEGFLIGLETSEGWVSVSGDTEEALNGGEDSGRLNLTGWP